MNNKVQLLKALKFLGLAILILGLSFLTANPRYAIVMCIGGLAIFVIFQALEKKFRQ